VPRSGSVSHDTFPAPRDARPRVTGERSSSGTRVGSLALGAGAVGLACSGLLLLLARMFPTVEEPLQTLLWPGVAVTLSLHVAARPEASDWVPLLTLGNLAVILAINAIVYTIVAAVAIGFARRIRARRLIGAKRPPPTE